ncbi:MAG TPA: rhodanese-like domain-containing protein [Lacibacter sp.]|nr:rhodanese-like domain-containing protein [Lacibacter sp.]HMO87529.1 rhodanese-like domain-containing protein [Lacibacter sp.]HMP87074.1 rhodanese-like domain-containing protein [Lacibacter sp.]
MTTITPEELKARMDAGAEVHLVDVREPSENAVYNIGGILLPVGQIMAMQTDAIDHLKDKEVIFYCRSGVRSANAAQFAETMGFTQTVNLTGGMLAWQDKFGG